MTGFLSFLILCFMAFGWLALPLLPALDELRRKTDVAPLRVVREYDGNIRYFARGFQQYVQAQLAALPADWQQREAHNEYSNDVFADGSEFCVVRGARFPLSEIESENRTVRKIVLTCAEIDLPSDVVFSLEVRADKLLRSGEKTVFRAILGESDLVLGDNNSVLRWLHCEGSGTVGRSSTLYGRASSETQLTLAEECEFQRLYAPRLFFGNSKTPQKPNVTLGVAPRKWVPENAREQAPGHFFARGDVVIPANVHFEGNLVATGALRIGAGARVEGSTKSHGDTVLESGSCVAGSVVSAGRLRLEENCTVSGPLIAESDVSVGAGSRLGDEQNPTTLSAPNIEIQSGVVAHGTVWAREMGKVVTNLT